MNNVKNAIYTPKGKALEYGKLACNLYRGCGHRCSYCYAPAILRMDRQEFYDNPQPRKGIIEALRKDAKKIGDKYKEVERRCFEFNMSGKYPQARSAVRPEVFLCFTTDPYQPINEEHQLTRQAIEILHENDIAVNILTKGHFTDGELFLKNPHLSKLGYTLTGDEDGKFHGEGALDERMRRGMLEIAHDNGIFTWVSMEPVIFPDTCLWQIEHTHEFVDLFKLGKWNYDKRANDIDWHRFVNEAIELLEKLGCKYYIKEDLKGYVK